MQAGKEFPDMRQNERRIEFVRVGDAAKMGPAQQRADFESDDLVS